MAAEVSARARRSLLFVPGLRPERFDKALASGADVVCVDIEDAVGLDFKAEARALSLPLFARAPQLGVECMLRINALSTRDGLRDLDAILSCDTPPPSLMLPKLRSPDEIKLLDRLLTGKFASIRYCVIVETNEALEHAVAIAQASSRVDSMIMGGVDLSADLRCAKEWEALLYARSRLVHAAASAGIDLLDVPFLALDDEAGLAREAQGVARLGFTGKASIHPKQLPIIHAAFTPSAAEIAKAKKVIAAFEAAPAGLVVVEGELIELPVVRSMYRKLAVAQRIAARPVA